MALDLRDLRDEWEDLKDRKAVADADDEEMDEDDADRLALLNALDAELGDLDGYAENEPSAIDESDFTDYVEECAYDFGMIERDSQMRFYVDWDRMAQDWKHDYHEFDFDGSTYLVRAY